MGNLFNLESKPEIRGETPKISEEESNYFSRINTFLRDSYIKNLYSDENLKNSSKNSICKKVGTEFAYIK